jgi:hypothetical protein
MSGRKAIGRVCLGLAGLTVICSGCIAGGDVVAMYRVRGTLVESETNAPLSNATVWLTQSSECRADNTQMVSAQTAADGSFSAELGQWLGSVLWIIIPVHWPVSAHLPPLEHVYLQAQLDGRVGEIEIRPSVADQKMLPDGGREVPLGVVPVAVEPAR